MPKNKRVDGKNGKSMNSIIMNVRIQRLFKTGRIEQKYVNTGFSQISNNL